MGGSGEGAALVPRCQARLGRQHREDRDFASSSRGGQLPFNKLISLTDSPAKQPSEAGWSPGFSLDAGTNKQAVTVRQRGGKPPSRGEVPLCPSPVLPAGPVTPPARTHHGPDLISEAPADRDAGSLLPGGRRPLPAGGDLPLRPLPTGGCACCCWDGCLWGKTIPTQPNVSPNYIAFLKSGDGELEKMPAAATGNDVKRVFRLTTNSAALMLS